MKDDFVACAIILGGTYAGVACFAAIVWAIVVALKGA